MAEEKEAPEDLPGDEATLAALTLDLIRLATALAGFAARPPAPLVLSKDQPRTRSGGRPASKDRARPPTAREVAALIAARQARAAAFGLDLAHPGWSLLLELYRAHLAAPARPEPVEGGVRIGRLAAAARVTLTSTMRWLDRLAAAGLAERRPDPADEHGILVALTPAGAEAMAEHFAAAASPLILSKDRARREPAAKD